MTKSRPISTTSTVPADAFERRSWFNTQLALRGITQAELAERIGCSRQMISQCLISPKSERIETGMAEAIGLTARQLFPERHAVDGSRLYRTVATKRAA